MRRFNRYRWLLAIWALSVAPLFSGVSRADGPTTSPTWGTPVGGGDGGGAAAANEIQVGTDFRKLPLFGPVGCPVFLIEQDVYSVKTLARICTLESDYPSNNRHVISPDGKLFAVSSIGQNQEGGSISVYDLATGARDSTFTPSGKFADVLVFGEGKNVFVGGRDRPRIEQFDATSGKLIRTINLPPKSAPMGPSATTADGRYFALPCDDRIVVFSGIDGSRVLTLNAPPVHRQPGAGTDAAKTPGTFSNHPDRIQRMQNDNQISVESVIFNAWIDGMAFSPDGRELAANSRGGSNRLVIWSHSGSVVGDVKLGGGIEAPLEQRLSWSPDGSMLLIRSDTILDRKTLQVTMRGETGFGDGRASIFLDNDHLVAYTPHDGGVVRKIALPTAAVKQALAAMADEKAPAKLRPGDAVAIQVQMGDLKGDGEEARTAVTDAVTHLLGRGGFKVDPQSKLIMVARFAEKTGKDVKVFQKDNPFEFGPGHDTGQTVQDYHSTVDMALWSPGDTKPIWFESAAAGSGRMFSTPITNDTMRSSMLQGLKSQIDNLHLPAFVSADPSISPLPAYIDELSVED
jgi:WD40 repeat protein